MWSPWIGVDLDGVLSNSGGSGENYDVIGVRTQVCVWIGDPVPDMVDRVKVWLSQGKEVRIFTARVSMKSGEIIAIKLIMVSCVT